MLMAFYHKKILKECSMQQYGTNKTVNMASSTLFTSLLVKPIKSTLLIWH